MSRLARKPLIIPAGVTIQQQTGSISVTGPKGTLTESFPGIVTVRVEGNELWIDRVGEDGFARAMQGTLLALVRNMITGVTDGFKRTLELVGVGYRVAKKGQDLEMSLGFSHPVVFTVPNDIQFEVDKNSIHLTGVSKQLLGETAANIRKLKKPEPYKGKGIKYSDEVIRRKAGKAGKAK